MGLMRSDMDKYGSTETLYLINTKVVNFHYCGIFLKIHIIGVDLKGNVPREKKMKESTPHVQIELSPS